MNLLKAAFPLLTLSLLGCPSEDAAKGRDIPVAKTAVDTPSTTKTPAPPKVSVEPGRVVAATAPATAGPTAPSSMPVAPKEVPPKKIPLAPSLASCFVFPKGITILTSEAQLKKLKPDPDGVEGCPKELPPSGINFAELSLVVASQTAKCSGRMTGTEAGFVWTETGTCDETSILRASVMIAKDKAKSLTIKKLER